MITIQYKVFTNLRNPNSKTGIRKPWVENRSSENRKKQRNFFFGAPEPFRFEPIDPHWEFALRIRFKVRTH